MLNKSIWCKLGFHKLDWDKAHVINVWGECIIPCKRCWHEEIVDGELVSSHLFLEIIKSKSNTKD
jgi:hypothetical protein